MPARPPHYDKLKSFADIFVEQCGVFPNADSRDLVDTMTQVLIRMNLSGWITNPKDEPKKILENKKPVFY